MLDLRQTQTGYKDKRTMENKPGPLPPFPPEMQISIQIIARYLHDIGHQRRDLAEKTIWREIWKAISDIAYEEYLQHLKDGGEK